VAASPEPNPGAPASAAQPGFRSLFLRYRLHVDSHYPSASLRAGSGAQRKTTRSGIAESLNTMTVPADEGGVGKTWVALGRWRPNRESRTTTAARSQTMTWSRVPKTRRIPRSPAISRDLPRESPARAHQPGPDDDAESDDQPGSQDEDAEDDDSDWDDEPGPDDEQDLEDEPARDLPRPPARIRPARPPAGAGRRRERGADGHVARLQSTTKPWVPHPPDGTAASDDDPEPEDALWPDGESEADDDSEPNDEPMPESKESDAAPPPASASDIPRAPARSYPRRSMALARCALISWRRRSGKPRTLLGRRGHRSPPQTAPGVHQAVHGVIGGLSIP
jgi:hypothetical protein